MLKNLIWNIISKHPEPPIIIQVRCEHTMHDLQNALFRNSFATSKTSSSSRLLKKTLQLSSFSPWRPKYFTGLKEPHLCLARAVLERTAISLSSFLFGTCVKVTWLFFKHTARFQKACCPKRRDIRHTRDKYKNVQNNYNNRMKILVS